MKSSSRTICHHPVFELAQLAAQAPCHETALDEARVISTLSVQRCFSLFLLFSKFFEALHGKEKRERIVALVHICTQSYPTFRRVQSKSRHPGSGFRVRAQLHRLWYQWVTWCISGRFLYTRYEACGGQFFALGKPILATRYKVQAKQCESSPESWLSSTKFENFMKDLPTDWLGSDAFTIQDATL
jgi:hypothetical protein